MTPVYPALCALLPALKSSVVLGLDLRQKLQSILMSRITQQECMCIFEIVSSLERQPSGSDPCPLQGQGRSPEKEPFVPGCQFSCSSYSPRDLPRSEWALRSSAISTWVGDFSTMDKAVWPACRGERKGEVNFILSTRHKPAETKEGKPFKKHEANENGDHKNGGPLPWKEQSLLGNVCQWKQRRVTQLLMLKLHL
jgi:hypothetical protein